MPSSLATLSSRSLSPIPQADLPHLTPHPSITLRFRSRPALLRLQSSRRTSEFFQESGNLVDDFRNWSQRSSFAVEDYGVDDTDDEEDEDGEEDRSLDLLVRFVQNMFKKISRKARKAVRSVLPPFISTKLVGFSVNGTIILAFFWILKAFLEVVCTLGSVVFVSILLIRGIWSGITYLQESRNHKINEVDNERHAWTGAQPAT